jgi:hypothetical protein
MIKKLVRIVFSTRDTQNRLRPLKSKPKEKKAKVKDNAIKPVNVNIGEKKNNQSLFQEVVKPKNARTLASPPIKDPNQKGSGRKSLTRIKRRVISLRRY